jgi:carbon-monoxide dehydrogenase small subunit
LLISTYYLLSKNAKPTGDEIRKAIAGNTCRCTGYQNVLKAIQVAAETSPKGKA